MLETKVLILRRSGFPLTIYSTKPVSVTVCDYDNRDAENKDPNDDGTLEQLEEKLMSKEEMDFIINRFKKNE